MSKNLIDSAYRNGELVKEFMILPFGKSWLRNKPIILDSKSRTLFDENTKEYRSRMMDYNGESLFDDLTFPSGWFHPVIKGDGLYATEVAWCSKAKELINTYTRYYSDIYPITSLLYLNPVYLLDAYSVRVCNVKGMSLNVLSKGANRELFRDRLIKFLPDDEFYTCFLRTP